MHKVFNDPLLAMEPPIALVTLRRQDGSEALLRTSAAPLLANLDGEHEANAGPGESYTVSKPSEHKAPRVPRQPEFDGWPLLGLALLFGLGVPFVIAVGSELIQIVRMVLP